MKRKVNKLMIIFSVLNLIFTILFLYCSISLNIIPIKYIFVIIIILFLMNFGGLCLLKNKNKIIKGIGIGLSILIVIISTIGIYYLTRTDTFLNQSFGNADTYHTNTYYIITKSNKNDLNNAKVGYYENAPGIEEALLKVKTEMKLDTLPYSDLYNLFKDLKNEKINAILLEKSLYNFMIESSDTFNEYDYQIYSTFDIKILEEIEEINNSNDSFNIYIGGTDFTELYTDFNMIVTVNKSTNKIMLTSTPRDFYVTVYGKGGSKDLLGYAGVWGINTSRKTLGNLYDINIDYYVKINTQSLVELVDTLGGIEFCSDKSFTTTHATVMGTYDDTIGNKLYVSKGCKKYSGIEILTIARERKAYPDGDRQRQKNCQAIMISIFNKMVSPELITNYSNILSAVSNLYTTNIPKELVTELAKNTINGAKWSIEQQSVTGRNSSGYVHLSNVIDYVMIPNQDSVNQASLKIKMIEAGK